jgi:hypothetical protein
MKKIICGLAILAAASTAAVAKDLKHEKKAIEPTVATTQMTDDEMDKVTAGLSVDPNTELPSQVCSVAGAVLCGGQATGNSPSSSATFPGHGTGVAHF